MTIHEIEASNALADAMKAGVPKFTLKRIKPIANSLAMRCGFKDTEEVWRVAHRFGRIRQNQITTDEKTSK